MAKIKALLPNRQETELEIEEVTLLSVDEATRIPKRLLKNRDYWWLCSPGRLCDFSVVACVDGDDGYIYDDGLFVKYAHDVRPALRVRNLGSLNLKVGTVVRINDCSYYVIPGDMLLSKKYIGECSFRKDWKAPDANAYEKSDIKKFVDDWAVKQGFMETGKKVTEARLASGSFCTNLIPSGKENTAEAPADNTLPSISSPNGYQRLAMRTNDGKMTERLSKPAMEPGWDLGGIMEGCLGLSGESGELVDLIKKWIFHEKPLDEEHAKKELGDVLWYAALICESFGWKMEDIMAMNIEKLRKRYPDGFNPVQANNRAENDV